MTSIWFPNNKYPPNTKNYLPCFVLGGGFSIRRKGLVKSLIKIWHIPHIMLIYLAPNSQPPAQPTAWTYCDIRQLFLLLHDGVQFFLKGVLTLSLAIWATMPMMALYTTGDIPPIYNCILTITFPENWYIYYPYQQGMVTTFSYENNHVSTMAYMLIASYPVTNSVCFASTYPRC